MATTHRTDGTIVETGDDEIISLSADALFRDVPNYVGYALGKKVTKGEVTDVDAFVIFVKKKVPKDKLKETEVLPLMYEELPTDVVEIGDVEPYSLLPFMGIDPKKRHRPFDMGTSGANWYVTAGTNGIVLYDPVSQKKVIHTCIHVGCTMPNKSISEQQELRYFQPGPVDGGNDVANVVGKLHRMILLTPTSRNDSCVIMPDNQDDVRTNVLGIGEPNGVYTDLKVGDELWKGITRTTGKQSTTVQYKNASIAINYKFFNPATSSYETFRVLCTGCYVCTKCGAGGDSGSALFKIIGDKILFAAYLYGGSTTSTVLYDVGMMRTYGLTLPPSSGGGTPPTPIPGVTKVVFKVTRKSGVPGSCVVEVSVVDIVTEAPVQSGVISLTGPVYTRTQSTDANGKCIFDDVPVGDYNCSFMHTLYNNEVTKVGVAQ